jgi:phage terminase small subunit
MRGRKPKPAAVLKLEKGKLYDQQRSRAENEPTPRQEIIPRCPKGFSKEQRKLWKNFSQILRAYGLFNAANAPILELLARAWSRYQTCQRMIDEWGGEMLLVDRVSGEILKPHSAEELDLGIGTKPQTLGKPILNPYFKPALKLEERIMKSLGELGLSSIGMARIGSLLSNKVKAKSQMEELLD